VLLAAPTYFLHYAGFVGAPLALVVGVGAGRAAGQRRRSPGWPRVRFLAVLMPSVLGLVALASLTVDVRTGHAFPGTAFGQAVAGRGCVVSDSPVALALMDVLSRDLSRGCPLMVDVPGSRTTATRPGGPPRRRRGTARSRVAVKPPFAPPDRGRASAAGRLARPHRENKVG
jgi:hypothetical protein